MPCNIVSMSSLYSTHSRNDNKILSTTQSSNISVCYECKENNIRYDPHLNEHFCFHCGLQLRQNFDDIIPYQDIATAEFSEHRNKNYLLELIEIQEYKNKLNLKDYPTK